VLFWSRHPVDFAATNAQEMVKGGMTFQQMTDDLPLPHFKGRVENAAAAFGLESIELVAYEEAQKSAGGIVAEFCRRVGIPDGIAVQFASQEPVANTSLSSLAVQMIESLNRHRPLIMDGKRNPKRHEQEQTWLARVEGAKFDFPADMKMVLRRRCRPDVEWLNKTFGTHLYTDVFEDTDTYGGSSLPDLTISTLALAFSDLLLEAYR
jgi:hypothetical protein